MSIDHQFVADILSSGLIVWFFALGIFVFYQILSGRLPVIDLIHSSERGGQIIPERVAALVISVVVAIYIAWGGLHAEGVFDETLQRTVYKIPDIPENLLILLAGGKSLYLSGKIMR